MQCYWTLHVVRGTAYGGSLHAARIGYLLLHRHCVLEDAAHLIELPVWESAFLLAFLERLQIAHAGLVGTRTVAQAGPMPPPVVQLPRPSSAQAMMQHCSRGLQSRD